MYKSLIIVSLLISMIGFVEAKSYKYYSSKTGKPVSLNRIVKEIEDADVVFFGEFHDSSIVHKMEFAFLKKFYKHYPNVCVSMEMFERDVQHILDQYLDSMITEKQFIGNSRPWSNYKQDYSPIVEFAKLNRLPIIAANVPRHYASSVNKLGVEFLETIPEAEKEFVAKDIKINDGEYRERFIKVMKMNMGTAMHSNTSVTYDNIYAAQCLKDDTMAESIANYIKSNKGTKVIHYNGDFHSNSHLGTAQKLKLLMPELKIIVISSQLIPKEQHEIKDRLAAGDYIIAVTTK